MKKPSQFKPAWWLPGPHLQTLWPSFARVHMKLPYRRERFDLSDGDFINVDWLGVGQGPIVVLVHGVAGSSDSPYMKGLAKAVVQAGWRAALFHFRGCGGEPNRKPRAFHAGDSPDLQEVVLALQKRERVAMAAVGFSMGGNVLLKWLGETRQYNPLKAAVGISVPFDIAKSEERVSRGFSKFYQKYLTRDLRKIILQKFENTDVPAPINLNKLKKIKDVATLNDEYVAPVHGFLNRFDYYQRTSCAQYLKGIHVPTLILHAKDDPFLDAAHIPDDVALSDSIQLEVSPAGGHVGFVSGRWPWKAEYWIEKRVIRYLKDYLL